MYQVYEILFMEYEINGVYDKYVQGTDLIDRSVLVEVQIDHDLEFVELDHNLLADEKIDEDILDTEDIIDSGIQLKEVKQINLVNLIQFKHQIEMVYIKEDGIIDNLDEIL